MKTFQIRSLIKVIGAFLIGVALAGTVATAASTPSSGSVKVCVDNRTQALYLSPKGVCTSKQTLIDLGNGAMNAKAIASLVTPSVVSIKVVTTARTSTGSGFIYKSSAISSYIITNNHVIESAKTSGTITVELANGDQIPATIVGRDPIYDVAVIMVSVGNLPEIAIGDSSKVGVGDTVLAIGSPLGLASTVTSGIISALNRPVVAGTVGSESYVNAIQTDAAINPGNSGGALVDTQGRIIGVNSAIATLTSGGVSGSIGLGFSIPINEAKRVIDEIISTGRSTRPFMGVGFDPNYTGVGAKISNISPREGADKAGIVVGSIIKNIGGIKITDPNSAIVRIRSYAPGLTILVTIEIPDGTLKIFKVLLGSLPSIQ